MLLQLTTQIIFHFYNSLLNLLSMPPFFIFFIVKNIILYKNNKIPVYVFGLEPGQLPRVAGHWNRPCSSPSFLCSLIHTHIAKTVILLEIQIGFDFSILLGRIHSDNLNLSSPISHLLDIWPKIIQLLDIDIPSPIIINY